MTNTISSHKIACHQCRHYRVTWDLQMPHGCRALGFKTYKNPSLVVYEYSGIECQLFEDKKGDHIPSVES